MELYQTPEVAEILIEQSNGGSVPAWETNDSQESSQATEVEETTEEE